ncbi:pyridoxal-dependent decarboxylase [Kocuria rhizophila]|nr:pyridoxal-dependent decarboxylase [Kocuria rhizophila]
MSLPLLHQDTVADLVRDVTTAAAAGAARMASAEQPHERQPMPDRRGPRARGPRLAPPDFDAAVDEAGPHVAAPRGVVPPPAHPRPPQLPVAVPAVAAETLAAAVLTRPWTRGTSPKAATVMERQLLAWTAGRTGFPRGRADGMFTPGGTTSNLQAMLARDECLERSALVPGAARRPVRRRRCGSWPARRATSPCHRRARARPGRRLRGPRARGTTAGCCPCPLCGAWSPTSRRSCSPRWPRWPPRGPRTAGSSTPPELAELCTAQGIWLHVDAAYGGGLLVPPAHRTCSRGSRARTPSRWTSTRPGSSRSAAPRCSCGTGARCATADAPRRRTSTPRTPPSPTKADRSADHSPLLDALKLRVMLRTLGPDAIGRLLDTVIDLAARTADGLRTDPRFELVCEPSLSTVPSGGRPRPGGRSRTPTVGSARSAARCGNMGATVAETEIEGRPCLSSPC